MANKIQIKRGAKANLPVLSAGEPAFTTDTKEFFIGDGSSNIEFAKQSDLDITNIKLSDLTYQTAGGTATAITLTTQTLVNGYAKTFIASTNNNAAATTINGKPLYKPGTTVAPNLIAGKAYTVWYSSTGGCFFIKASAEGTAGVGQVLAGYTFSNDSDTGLSGTISSKSAATYTPTTTDQTIAANQYLSGAQTVKGDANLVTGNIKSGASIFGVAGKSSVVDTADANAAAGQILNGQTSYVNGGKITGTMPNRANTKFQICGYEGITECIPHPSDPGNQGLVTGQNVYGATGYIDGNSQIQMSVAGLVPGNIKAGVKVGKNSGTGSSVMTGTFTSDATANAGQILNGQTAYVNGNKITGTMANYSGQTKSYSTLTDSNGNIGPNMISINEATGGDLATHVAFKPDAGYYDGNTQIDLRVWGINSADVKAGAPIGYPNNSLKGTFTSDATANAGQILNGQTAYVNGSKITGTMPQVGYANTPSSCGLWGDGSLAVYLAQSGYYMAGAGGSEVKVPVSQMQAACPSLNASNILSGKSIFGVAGNATISSLGGASITTGTTYATNDNYTFTETNGTVQSYRPALIVSGLSFTPKLILSLDSMGGITIYDAYSDPIFSGVVRVMYRLTPNSGTSMSGYVYSINTNSCYINNGGFCIPVPTMLSLHSWIAIG